MQSKPLGQVLLRLDASAHPEALQGQVTGLALDRSGHLWCSAGPLDGLLRLRPAVVGEAIGAPGVAKRRWHWQRCLNSPTRARPRIRPWT